MSETFLKVSARALPLILLCQGAHATSCDSSYTCTSSSGKYVIWIERCRDNNSLGDGVTLLVDGTKASDVKADAARWDGDQYLAFQLDFPSQGEARRILSVEVSRKIGAGTIRDRSKNDEASQWGTTRSEAIGCIISG